MNKKDIAKENFQKGYNCCQSVLKTYSNELGIDEKTLLNLGSSFGRGMGRLREVCGAVSAMFMIAGIKKGYNEPEDREGKIKQYALIQEMAKKFKEKNGSIVCRELLESRKIAASDNPVPDERTKEYYQKRSCTDYISDAVEIIDIFLGEKEC